MVNARQYIEHNVLDFYIDNRYYLQKNLLNFLRRL